MRLFTKLRALFRKEKLDAEMAEEMRVHLESLAERNCAAGMSADDARHAARRQFGGVEQIKERCRDLRRTRWLDEFRQDVRYGLRVVAKSPVVSAVIVLSLAVGLGANTAVFSWIRTVALEPLPGVADSGGLAIIEHHTTSGIIQFVSPAGWRDLREQTSSFADILAHNIATFNLEGRSQDVRIWGENVSGNFFMVLGVQPATGRVLRPADDEPGGPAVAVISHKLWQGQFGGRPDAIGQSLRLNDRSYTIVGVAPPEFQGAVPSLAFDVWLPQGIAVRSDDRRSRVFELFGRLRPGVTLRQATADVAMVLKRMADSHPDTDRGVSAEAIPLWRSRIGAQALLVPILATLQTVMFLLLLVVCTNTANLLLAQATTRGKEIAIRLSLGAGRARVVRQLLTEGLLLALLGAGLGSLLAIWWLDMINRIPKPTGMPVAIAAHLDRTELFFSIGLAMVCALIFGLAPALQTTRGDVAGTLKVGGRTSGGAGRRRLQELLVGAEIALTLVIVIVAGLFVKSFQNARHLTPGFEPRHVLLGTFDLVSRGYDLQRAQRFPAALLTKVRELPGVEHVAVATWVPLDLIPTQPMEFVLEGRAHDGGEPDHTLWYEVTDGYFETLQIKLLEGRDFSGGSDVTREPEAVVNEDFARRYLTAGQTALGRRLTIRDVAYRIVGVVRTAKYNTLSEAPQPMVYLTISGQWRSRVSVFVRTAQEPAVAFAAVKAALHDVDPGLPFLDNRTMEQHLENAMIVRFIPAKLLAVLGPLALLLAASGLYSVLAYAVAQRTHEIGVRMTLGATPGAVVRLIMRQGMTAVVAGMGVGIIVAFAASVRLARELVNVPAGDVTLFAPLLMLLAAVALLACWLPARRAAKVDPMVALRAE